MLKKIIIIILLAVSMGCKNHHLGKDIKTRSFINPLIDLLQKNEPKYNPDFFLPEGSENLEIKIPVLMFHYIRDYPEDSTDQLGYNLSFSPTKLESFAQFLSENEIKTLTFWDLKSMIENNETIPEKAIILSFDDGYKDHYDQAFSILKKYDLKGVFFVISSKPDNDPNYASWNDLQEMARGGNEIASHTVNHPDLTTLSTDQLRFELEESKLTIEREIGMPVISFCYPSGRYNQEVLDLVSQNYLFARTTNYGREFFLNNRYEIPTIRIYPESSVESLKIWLNL